jgi:putative membrane protein
MNRKLWAILISCSSVAMQPIQALAQAQPSGGSAGPWWAWGDGFGWQYWWICPLMMLFMIAVFVSVFFIFRRSSAHGWQPPWRSPSHSALQILSERLARGEIQRSEYEEKKAAILSSTAG